VTLRLPAFRFLHFCFFVARVEQSETRERQPSRTFVPGFRCAQSRLRNDETGVTEDRKPGPTPALSLDQTGFALHVTVFCRRALRSLSRAENLGRQYVSRECERHPPPRSGGGGPLELAQRANRGGGGAGRGASLAAQKFLVARRSERTCPKITEIPAPR
jgi:hypothetical protein